MVARAIELLSDPDLAISGTAAYLLGERAYRHRTAVEVEAALTRELERALSAANAARMESTVAALRECVRVGGAHALGPLFLEVLRRSLERAGTSLAGMWAAEALTELGWSPDQIMIAATPLAPDAEASLRDLLAEITSQ